jgi:hypothetical protein
MAAFTISDLQDTLKVPMEVFDPTQKPGRGVIHVLKRTIDFDALATATGTALTNADTYQIFDLQANTIVLAAGINVLVAATNAADCDLGFTGGLTTRFVEGQIMNAIGVSGTYTVTNGCYPIYIAAVDTLDLVTATQTLAGCTAEVWAVIIRL